MAINAAVYLCAEHQYNPALDSYLSDDELRRANAFVQHGDRRRFVLARAVLRWALNEQLGWRKAGWPIVQPSGGRPTLRSLDLRVGFSISHTDGLVGVLLSSVERCGLDIESFGRDVDVERLARRACSPSEIEWLQSHDRSDQQIAFLRLWTLKEAYLKATGRGIARSLKRLSFDLKGEIRMSDMNDPDGSIDAWQFRQWEHDGEYLVAVAQAGVSTMLKPIVLSADGEGFKDERTA